MTPSNSSAAHSFSRTNQCSLPYGSPKAGGILRRILQKNFPGPSQLTPERSARTAHSPLPANRLIKGEAEVSDSVTDFLHDTVSDLWREQRVENNAAMELADDRQTAPLLDGSTRSASLNGSAKHDAHAAPEARDIPAWKRILDVTLVVATSPVWLPLMLLLMLAVRLSSPGPIFYRQARVGFLGRTFMIYKFRSMKVDAETQVHEAHFERLMKESVPMVKLDGAGDPRILPWGRLMRATGLDELPQIFNVIRGEMSLVGPRPCTIPEFSRYARWQRERVNAPPGLTGYWQVNGKNRTTFNEMIEMDIYYSKKMSLSLDLKIMLQTMPALVDQTIDTLAGSRNPGKSSYPAETGNPEGT